MESCVFSWGIEILHQLFLGKYPILFFRGLQNIPGGCFGISSINSIINVYIYHIYHMYDIKYYILYPAGTILLEEMYI